ncbi:hypothetical protein F9Y90_02915 [Borrelia miyamotoi]|uniref:Variable large protein n=1 Tax=Borrelia miyamotoi TaxID=47466 RepID=A0AAX3JMV1_9SPIR|nr:hypothetical protein [Borrelia miyamotoi]QFP42052.1 hypothetical protein F9Y90_02915 [Borrelia miyamotoi]QFP48168.1 hypothetical protein F9Y91_02910 [Borrelia miyamotoi]QGT55927.1 hypothetical protein GNY89_02920 [Borrelia miyamotoi]QGT56707.1 hypothetical protein GNY88_02920 [Borrelia miyamotoi]WAZ71968.1 hypothetical protein O5404_02960 [Borrelia miyamotoi]
MDIKGSSEVAKIITQGAFDATEISNEDIRKKKVRDDKNVGFEQGKKSYHVASAIDSLQTIDELRDGKLNVVTKSKIKTSKKSTSDICDANLHDPKLGKNVDIER